MNVDTHAVVTLPLNGLRWTGYRIAPGNTSDSPSNPKLGGSLHWGSNFFTIDGSSFNDLGNGGAAYSYQTALSTTPLVDTIQEYKIETNNAKAETKDPRLSRSSPNRAPTICTFRFSNSTATVNLRRSILRTSQPMPAFNRNEFGATVGGPIIKNKTFFFGSYEGMRQRTASTPFLALGTAAMRNGNFSGLGAIRDPLPMLRSRTIRFLRAGLIRRRRNCLDSCHCRIRPARVLRVPDELCDKRRKYSRRQPLLGQDRSQLQ